VLLAALGAVPLVVDSPYALHIMVLLFLWTCAGAGWNVIGGYTGQYSVGHAAYFGVGAYATLLLLEKFKLAPWWGIWIAIVAALVLALIIGSICFRLRGPYFVLASIAVAEILRLITLNWKEGTNGAEGVLLSEVPVVKVGDTVLIDWLSKAPFYYIGLALAALAVAANALVQHSKLGYYFQAIREDQDAANSLGINLYRYKNIALGISAVFTALAGAFYGLYVQFIDPSTVLGLDVSVQTVLVCIIGGIGTIFGPVVGAIAIAPLSEMLRAWLGQAHALVYGILVVVVILFMPEGVLGFVRRVGARRARREQASVAAGARPEIGGSR
jgi:branched-chain amino acid transport system permease protein